MKRPSLQSLTTAKKKIPKQNHHRRNGNSWTVVPKLPEKSPTPFLFSQLDEMKKSSYFLVRPNTKIEIKKGTGIALEVAENRPAIYCPYTVIRPTTPACSTNRFSEEV